MPEVNISIGGRSFEVACQSGEEQYLHAAAKMLDGEASLLSNQIGRMPEARMLLMAGLMLADKTAGLEERLEQAEQELVALRKGAAPAEVREVRVEIVPPSVQEALANAAAKVEALADQLDAKRA
ncbi:MAG: cell division protein ZapA [Paracoccaceae bacterium]|nr:cell division protein ZapA [Paracoccaceae bacterium]MDG1736907.1 cell division protein ZapA [Paracoccaceae bacterium]MDG2259365.1 cell division protein ZapA [Paracoccaceae bacterium]